MTPQEHFEFQRAAFRKFLGDKSERECQLLIDDIRLRIAYLHSIKPENIISGLMPMDDNFFLEG